MAPIFKGLMYSCWEGDPETQGVVCFPWPYPSGAQYKDGPIAAFRERFAAHVQEKLDLWRHDEADGLTAEDVQSYLVPRDRVEEFQSARSRYEECPWWWWVPFTGVIARFRKKAAARRRMEELCDVSVETNHDYDACVVILSKRHDAHELSREITIIAGSMGLTIPRHDSLPEPAVLLTSNATFSLDKA